MITIIINLTYYVYGIGYACRADKNPYWHDRRADKNPYRHDRRADSQCRTVNKHLTARRHWNFFFPSKLYLKSQINDFWMCFHEKSV